MRQNDDTIRGREFNNQNELKNKMCKGRTGERSVHGRVGGKEERNIEGRRTREESISGDQKRTTGDCTEVCGDRKGEHGKIERYGKGDEGMGPGYQRQHRGDESTARRGIDKESHTEIKCEKCGNKEEYTVRELHRRLNRYRVPKPYQ